MPDASVIIVTRNRKELAKRAVESALAQSVNPEVILVDDASDDGTADEIRSAFPHVRVHHSASHKGLIVQRNVAVQMCNSPIVVSLDDDAQFTDPNTIRDSLRLFEEPRVAAAAIPFINRSLDGSEQRMLPAVPDDGRVRICHTFVGTAFAIRRDVFLRLRGFQGALFHWGEEGEYCQRLLAAGYVVALGSRGMILHEPAGVATHSRKVNRYVYRAGMLGLWLNAPTLLLAPLMMGQMARYLLSGIRRPGQLPAILEGCAMGLSAIMQNWKLRKPLSLSTYRLWLRLRREMPVALHDVANELPPMIRA